MKTPLNLLIVEDVPDDAELVLAELRRGGFDPTWKQVQTEPDFLAALEKHPDLILSDYSMPQFSGLRALELLKASTLNIPFILISGTVGEDIAVESIKNGATDYLLKDRLNRLAPAVRRALQETEALAERKRLEAQFIEAQKMEVIGQLAGGVAHDFNNVLAVIMGYSDLIKTDLDPESPIHQYNDEIRHASERAVGLTRQLLVFSRKESVQPVVLDLNEAIKNLEKMLRRLVNEHIAITCIPAKASSRIKADVGYVGQVLMNLVVNARDAMPNGGKLTIATENVTLDPIHAAAIKDVVPGEYVRLSVADTGTGMTEEIQAHAFEPFFTTKAAGKGTGLGLATCRMIVKQSGGGIKIHSQPGLGTTFQIYFPRVDEPLDAETEFLKAGPVPRGTETLLFVEDEHSVRHLAVRMLETQGYTVLRATNGQDGLRVAREHQGAPIRMVITDVIMPVMGGKVMVEWLKTTYPGLKILFTSGYTDEVLTKNVVLDAGTQYLAKPYTTSSLARKVREMLDQP